MSKKPFGTALVALGLLFIAAIGFRTISTPEIWTHLAQGRVNAPISFLASDGVVNTTWLYDKLAYAAWNMGGANLLILLNIAGLLGTFILLLQVSKKWGGALSQGFALLISGHLLFQSLDVGPMVVMMLCIALTLYLVSILKQPGMLFATLVPLEILWTNLHGSFIYGPLIVALMAFQAQQQKTGSTGRKRKKQGIQSNTYAMLAVAMLAATLANPYFLGMHEQVIANIQNGAPSYWSSLFLDYFQIPAMKPLILFTMLLGAGGLITLKKKLPVTLTTLAIYSAFLVWTSPKMAPLFVVMAFPFIVLSLTSISEYIQTSLESMLGKQAKLVMPVTGTVLALLFICSLVPIVNNCAYVKTGSASNFGLGIQEELYPSGADAIIGDSAFPETVINLAADGGYLAFNYDRKIFIDYRPGRYDKELLTNLDAMLLGNKKAYDHIYDTYRPEAFIINTLHPSAAQGIVTLLSKGIWRLAYFDGTTAILLLNKDEFSDILNNHEAQASGLAQLEKARSEYAKKTGACHTGNPAELIGSGKVYLALNRPREAKAIFALLLQNNNSVPGAWIGLGNSQLLMKEFEDGAASLKTATELAPQNLQAWLSYANACNMCATRLKQASYETELKRAMEKVKQLAERSKKAVEENPSATETEEPAEAPEDISLPDLS